MEPIDDMVHRVAERCRDVIEEEMTRYFANLLSESGLRTRRGSAIVDRTMEELEAEDAERVPGMDGAARIISRLTMGPQILDDLMRQIGCTTKGSFYSSMSIARKRAEGMGMQIVTRHGHSTKDKDVPTIYALRELKKDGKKCG